MLGSRELKKRKEKKKKEQDKTSDSNVQYFSSICE
jgi:hypothetical protein